MPMLVTSPNEKMRVDSKQKLIIGEKTMKTTREDFELMSRIADRMIEIWKEYGAKPLEKFTVMMDLENAHEHFNLDLSGLLDAEVEDFAHDVCGICKNIDRTNPKNCDWNYFCPRYARS